MKGTLAVAIIALAITGSAMAQVETWEIDPNHTASQFSIRHLGISTVRGSFNKTTGTVQYDPKNPAATVIETNIDAATINTRNETRDSDLRGPTYFDTQNHPAITFKSKKVEPAGEGRLKATGNLTIRGVTKEVVLEIEGPTEVMRDPRGNLHMGASASTKVKRTDFGIGKPGPMLGEEVPILIDIELVKPAAANASK